MESYIIIHVEWNDPKFMWKTIFETQAPRYKSFHIMYLFNNKSTYKWHIPHLVPLNTHSSSSALLYVTKEFNSCLADSVK